MKKKITFITIFIMLASTFSVNAVLVPKESAPCNAAEESIVIAESLISGVLDEVQNGLGYGEARAKSHRLILNAVINNQTNGYGYAILSEIADNAIFQYRDMYLRPDFFIENEGKVKLIISEVITQYANGKIDYNTAIKNGYEKIYQSVNPAFNFDEQLAIDTCYRDIPSVDSALFTIARRLLLNTQKSV